MRSRLGSPIRCRFCGCTETDACPGGCTWRTTARGVPIDICTHCPMVNRCPDCGADVIIAQDPETGRFTRFDLDRVRVLVMVGDAADGCLPYEKGDLSNDENSQGTQAHVPHRLNCPKKKQAKKRRRASP